MTHGEQLYCDSIALVTYILEWWEDAQYDIERAHGDEYNVYENEPSFVTKAKVMKERYEYEVVNYEG